MLLARVADRAPGVALTEDAAIGLFDTVTEFAAIRPDLNEVGAIEGLEPPGAVIDDSPSGTLLRGWGYCDSTAMAFVQVAERRGFRGRLMFLHDETGVSPHTVATLMVDGEWRVFDTLTHRYVRDDVGALATLDDIASGRAAVTGERFDPAWYGRATVFYETPEPAGIWQWVKSAPTSMLSAVGRSPLGDVIAEVYMRAEPPTFITVDGRVWEDWSDPGDRAFWEARNEHLFTGDHARAAELYGRAIALGSDRAYEAHFYLQRLTEIAG
ncbi:MAG: hypothetical protein WD990_12610 [Acidimicrobiia bacterium]